MATILKGADVVSALNEQIKADVKALKDRGITPTLAIVRVGERGDDISYERGATKRAQSVGIDVQVIVLPEDVTQEDLLSTIHSVNEDSSVHGVLMFRPLPAHIDEDVICNALDPAKDVDGITDISMAAVFSGADKGFAPCTPCAVMEILALNGYDLKGKDVVVVGRSLVVGKPVAMMLLARHATVTIAHSRTADLRSVVKGAQVVVACVGRAKMIDASYVSAGSIVIDVGINVSEDGSLAGDCDTEALGSVASAITPVPGGVGTVTTSVLMKHVVQAAMKKTRG